MQVATEIYLQASTFFDFWTTGDGTNTLQMKEKGEIGKLSSTVVDKKKSVHPTEQSTVVKEMSRAQYT